MGFPFPNSPINLDLSYEIDLDFGGLFCRRVRGRAGESCLIIEQMWFLLWWLIVWSFCFTGYKCCCH